MSEIDEHSNTKLRVEQLLQQVVSQSTNDAVAAAKNKKKKKKNTDETIVLQQLESLRKGKGIEGLHKEEDTALLANIYEPDNSPKNEKSNKQRQKKLQSDSNEMKDNNEIAKSGQKMKKTPKKIQESDLSLVEDKIIEKNIIHGDMAPEPVPRERKKKKKPEDAVQLQSDQEVTASPSMTTPAAKPRKKTITAAETTHTPSSGVAPANLETPVITPRERGKKNKNKKPEHAHPEETPLSKTEEPASPLKEEKKKKKRNEPKDEITYPQPEESAVPSKEEKKKKRTKDHKEEPPPLPEESPSRSKERKKKKKSTDTDTEPVKSDDAGSPSTNISPKERKKKKKTPVKNDEVAEANILQKEAENLETEIKDVPETAKTKKKKKKGADIGGAGDAGSHVDADKIEEQPPPEAPDYGEVLAVIIHRTDKLKNDFNILHPLVRVHVVDENTGQYLPKQHRDRAVTSYYEIKKVEFVLPIMTQPFDFKQKKSAIPMWEELLIFNENFNYFTQTSPKTLMLFELLDFISMNAANNKQEGGWYRIAWAFLKVLGGNERVNVGSKVRLQLFQVPSKNRTQKDQIEIYQWWKSSQRVPYPSTLYVTLKSIVPPVNVEPSMRSMFATQQEEGVMSYQDLKRSMNWDSKTQKHEVHTITSWTRLFGQLCRIPNNLILTLSGGKKGCFVIRFSHDGRSLACACGDKEGYPIFIYQIPSGELKLQLKGHYSLVYDLSWSKKDTHLVSASSDGTVRLWNILEGKTSSEKILPHPGFVYTCKFHPRVDSIVVTGCYDQVLRVWDISLEDENGQLVQEIEDHHGHINSICFDVDDGQKMYSADSTGVVNSWNVYVTDELGRRAFVRDWTLFQTLKEPELKDVPISHIEMHPSGRRLLVHSRDNCVCMFDLRVQRMMQQYIGAINFRDKLGSCLTPCGTFVFAGSEDSFVYAWNTDTGDQVARYTDLNYQNPVTDVAYHPRDHILAICSLGENQPILIYKYDPFMAQVDAGLTRRAPVETTEVEQIAAGRKSPLQEDELASARTKVLTQSEFQAHQSARYQRIMRKLDTATVQMSQMPGMVTMDMNNRMDTIGRTGVISSWTNSFTTESYTVTPRSGMLSPGTLSPHAPHTMMSTIQQQQFSAQNRYMQQADAGWRPSFSEVGRHGTKSPVYFGRPPQIALSASGGKAQFSFQSTLSGSQKPQQSSQKKKQQVMALYDYKAQRSDELTIFRGDLILLLHKDSDNWWMGELADGQQGFFPANYVTAADAEEEEKAHVPGSSSNENLKKSYTAVKTKDGELKFLSGAESEDSETEITASTSSLKQNKDFSVKKTKKVHYEERE